MRLNLQLKLFQRSSLTAAIAARFDGFTRRLLTSQSPDASIRPHVAQLKYFWSTKPLPVTWNVQMPTTGDAPQPVNAMTNALLTRTLFDRVGDNRIGLAPIVVVVDLFEALSDLSSLR